MYRRICGVLAGFVAPLPFYLTGPGFPVSDATRGGEIPIISQFARILNNRC
jgi:hypothetical protein